MAGSGQRSLFPKRRYEGQRSGSSGTVWAEIVLADPEKYPSPLMRDKKPAHRVWLSGRAVEELS